jgi:AraC-like DNA-binding protein
MDRHDGLNTTAKSLAEAHQLDLKVQKKFSCKALTYWFDEGKQIAFCLIEAPDKNAVEEMHRNSYGLVPNQIIEVNSEIVEYFLGRIADPAYTKNSEQFINETAFRSILYVDCKLLLTNIKSFKPNGNGISEIINNLIRPAITEHDGIEVKVKSDGLMASFTSVSKSLRCAVKIQTSINQINIKSKGSKIFASIGLSTGYPVENGNDFFGETVLRSKRLSEVANEGEIVLSNDVRNEYAEKEISAGKRFIKIISLSDEKFLNQLMEMTEKIWNDDEFNVEAFSKQIGLSRAQLYRKVTALTGYSPNEFINTYRLNKALKLIERKYENISEIAFETGFSNPSYFSKCFQKKFGILPSEYSSAIP